MFGFQPMMLLTCVLLAVAPVRMMVTPPFADNLDPANGRLRMPGKSLRGSTNDKDFTLDALIWKDVEYLAKKLSLARQGLQSEPPLQPLSSSLQKDNIPHLAQQKDNDGKSPVKISPFEIDRRIAHFKGQTKRTLGENVGVGTVETTTKQSVTKTTRQSTDVVKSKSGGITTPTLKQQAGLNRNAQHFSFPGEVSSASFQRGEGNSRVKRNAPNSHGLATSNFQRGALTPWAKPLSTRPGGKTEGKWGPAGVIAQPSPHSSTEWGNSKNEVPHCIDCYQQAFKKVLNIPKFPTYDKLKNALTRVKATSSRIFKNLNKEIKACIHEGLSATLDGGRSIKTSRQHDMGRARNSVEDDLYTVAEDNRGSNIGLAGQTTSDTEPYRGISPAALLALVFAKLRQNDRYRTSRLTALANARSAATLARASQNFPRNKNLLQSFSRASALMSNKPLPFGVREKSLRLRNPSPRGMTEGSFRFDKPLSSGVLETDLSRGRLGIYGPSRYYAPALFNPKPIPMPDSAYNLALTAPEKSVIRGRFSQIDSKSGESGLLENSLAPPFERPDVHRWSRNRQRVQIPRRPSTKATFNSNLQNTRIQPKTTYDYFGKHQNAKKTFHDQQKLASLKSKAKDILSNDHLTEMDLQFLQWIREMKDHEEGFVRRTRHGAEINNTTQRKWVVLGNKNSEPILRNLQAKVDRKARPWGVFPVLDVCAAKRKLRPLKPQVPTQPFPQRSKQQRSTLQILNEQFQKLQRSYMRG